VILIDADVLGRNRTGEETYVLNLLRQLPFVAPDLAFAAVTRRPDLVPDGVEPIELPARFQETRMAWSLPRLLRRLHPVRVGWAAGRARDARVRPAPRSASLPSVANEIPPLGSDRHADPARADP